MNGKLNEKTKHPKYPYQRAEQRYNNIDIAGLKEQKAMEKQSSTRISIGTFNIFPPKSDTKIANFTLAFPKSIPRDELYIKLKKAFPDEWDGEPTRSIFVRLSNPMQLQDIRKKLKDNFEDSFQKA